MKNPLPFSVLDLLATHILSSPFHFPRGFVTSISHRFFTLHSPQRCFPQNIYMSCGWHKQLQKILPNIHSRSVPFIPPSSDFLHPIQSRWGYMFFPLIPPPRTPSLYRPLFSHITRKQNFGFFSKTLSMNEPKRNRIQKTYLLSARLTALKIYL